MSREKRPPLSLASDKAVDDLYKYYASRPSSPWVTRGLGHPFGLLAYRTRYIFETGAESIISDHFGDGGQALLPLEHVKKSDPFVIAGVALRRPSLRPLVANTNITAKAELYNLHPIVAWFLDRADAQPAFQSHKDNTFFAPEASEGEINERIHRAGDRVVENTIRIIDDGGNAANFGRRGRRAEDDHAPITPDKLRMGVGRIACGVQDRSKLLILPAAVDYARGLLLPSLAFSSPFEVAETATPESIVAEAARGMQNAREMAADLSAMSRADYYFA